MIVTCEDCGIDVEAKRPTKRLCVTCRRKRQVASANASYQAQFELEAGRPSGTLALALCQGCGAGFTAKRRDAKFCHTCGPIMRKLVLEASEERFRQPCPKCGKLMSRKGTQCRSCANHERSGNMTGEKHPRYKGGRVETARGYVMIKDPTGRHTYVQEHRFVWERDHGPLPQGHVVHHLNGIKNDNRPENLVGMSRSHHGPRAHIDPTEYESRIRYLEGEVKRLRALLEN